MGLQPEDHYYFGNEYLSITDVSADSDNVLKDERGELFFIDPIIKLKKPAFQGQEMVHKATWKIAKMERYFANSK